MLKVVLVWHMHQPYYVNPSTQLAQMPWVRIHAVKGYFDMIHVLDAVPEMRATFNFTPVLVKQIRELIAGSVHDVWHDWSIKPASELDEKERASLLEHFFKANWDNLIKPYPRYWDLLNRRGFHRDHNNCLEDIKLFSVQDYRDLQTWFNLAWCGYAAETFFPEIAELKRKNEHFTENDKRCVLEIHHKILARILEDYTQAEQEGRIELTTTPYYHPILPLVYDTDLAKRSMPHRELPRRFQAPEDALLQLEKAVEQHQQVFGRKPTGLWPSEGSVAPELIPLFQQCGIQYFFSDEGILFRGLNHDPLWQHRKIDHLELFQGWNCEHGGANVAALFRERPLSDFIGFNAARNTPEAAAEYLIYHLEHLESVIPHKNGVVTLVLDGENAWEAFPDGGKTFLHTFYTRLSRHQKLQPVLPKTYFNEYLPSATLSHLHTGSWINSDFDIWIGDREENRAWKLLGETRHFLLQNQGRVSPEIAAKAWEAIYAAEGSDWFWWYGPDFTTDNDLMFDELFRSHLISVYRFLNTEPPPILSLPISLPVFRIPYQIPTLWIHPTINGRVNSYFEYAGAGRYDTAQQVTAMYQADRLIQSIWFGYNKTSLTIRVDFRDIPEANLLIYFLQPVSFQLKLPLLIGSKWDQVEKIQEGKSEWIPAELLIKEVLEVRFPLSALNVKLGDEIGFMLELIQTEVVLERHPERGLIQFKLLDEDAMLRDWYV